MDGVSILFITHKLEEIITITDGITVLRDGKYIKSLNTANTTIDEMVSLMVGREFEKIARRTFISDYTGMDPVLEVSNLTVRDRVKNASFKLYKGEVLGLTGLVGAGRTELLQGIFGMESGSRGEIRINGKPVSINHPSDAKKLGIGMVPEGRKEQGMFLKLSVQDNMTLVHLKKLCEQYAVYQ